VIFPVLTLISVSSDLFRYAVELCSVSTFFSFNLCLKARHNMIVLFFTVLYCVLCEDRLVIGS